MDNNQNIGNHTDTMDNYTPTLKAPTSAAFKAAYLDYNNYSALDVWGIIGGGLNDSYGEHGSIDDIANSCATRLSRGLNYAGTPIPKGSIGANKNYDGRTSGDGLYYIIQARKLRKYLHQAWGSPNQTLTHASQIDEIQNNLKAGQYAIIVSEGHAGAVSATYSDNYIRAYLGDMWILPV